MERDYSISVVRFMATCFIILCHILQFLGCELAFWFNVGVQIFLCISGWLYAKKNIENSFIFYIKNLLKLYSAYLIVVLLFGGIGLVFHYVSVREIIYAILCQNTFNGGSHLWFVPTILFCYFFTPFLQGFFDFVKEKKAKWFFIAIFFLLLHISVKGFFGYFTPAWISCYALGYLLGREKNKFFEIALCALAVICNICKIVFVYIMKIVLDGELGVLYNTYLQYTHVLLGILLFLSVAKICQRLKINERKKLRKFLDFSDAYSYPVYLVHQFFILGALSLMSFTSITIVNILLIIILILILAIPVKWISSTVNKWLTKRLFYTASVIQGNKQN